MSTLPTVSPPPASPAARATWSRTTSPDAYEAQSAPAPPGRVPPPTPRAVASAAPTCRQPAGASTGGSTPARLRPAVDDGCSGAADAAAAVAHGRAVGPDRGAQEQRARRAAQAARSAALRLRHGPERARLRGPQGPRRRARLAGPTAEQQRPGAGHPGDQRRHPGLRADRALPARPGRHRGHGQRPQQHLAGEDGQADRRPTRTSPTRPTCAARSTRSCRASAAASTSPARWSTPASPTAAVSTPSSRRWRSTARR